MTEPDVEGASLPESEPEAPPSLLESLTPVAPDWADGEAAEARLAGWGTATGTLTEFARWVGSVRPIDAPFRRVRLVAFAADHGVAGAGGATAGAVAAGADAVAVGAVAAEGAGVVEARALLAGEGALALLAQRADVSIRLVDVGLVGDALPGDVSVHRVRAGSPPLDESDPLTPEEVEAALDLGARVADEEVDGGADLVIPVVLSESALVPATVLIGALCGLEPVRALGYDAHVPDAVWIARCAAIRDGLHRVSQAAATLATRRLLAVGGGADLAAAAGFLVRSAARRTPALLDGVGAAAAALVARALAPDAPGWWFAPHASGRTGEKQAFASLRLKPVVDLGVRLGDGAGALLALPVLTAAIDLVRSAPQPVRPAEEEAEVTVDPGDEIGGVGGYEAGARAPEPADAATLPDATAPRPSGATTPEGSGAATPEGSGAGAPERSGAATPEGSGADAPGPSGADAPGPSGADAPGPSGADAPGPSGAATPGPSGAATPGPSGAATPGPSGAATPEGLGAGAPEGSGGAGDGVPIAHPGEVDPAVVEPLDPADPLALPPEPPGSVRATDRPGTAARPGDGAAPSGG